MGFLKLFGSKDSEQTDKKAIQETVKDVFLSDKNKMIHDLKTPLNGISGMAQLLRETALSTEQAEYVGVIEESIRAMLEQINRFSEKDQEGPKYSTVEIRGFLQRFLAHVKPEVDESVFGIHYKIDRQFPIQLMLEEEILFKLMTEVFQCLFSKRKKDLVIEALFPVDEDYALIVMRDKSLVYEDELIFVSESPFTDTFSEELHDSSLRYNLMRTIDGKIRMELYAYYQKDSKERTDDKELSIAKAIADNKEVSQVVVDEVKEESISMPLESPVFNEDKLILIAEDEVVGRVTLKLMLKERYDIIFAKNGKEAVELYFKRKPSLVLMDIMMPVVNGFEAFDEIEKNDKHRSPIIACTSKVISTEREYLTSYGFDDHLDKPIENEKLDEILMRYLGN